MNLQKRQNALGIDVLLNGKVVAEMVDEDTIKAFQKIIKTATAEQAETIAARDEEIKRLRGIFDEYGEDLRGRAGRLDWLQIILNGINNSFSEQSDLLAGGDTSALKMAVDNLQEMIADARKELERKS